MKKLLVVAVITIFGLLWYSSVKTVDKWTAKQLSEDLNVADFVLEDVMYTLPCPVTEFMDNGWEVEEYDPTTTSIGSKHIGEFKITHSDVSSDIVIYVPNDSDEEVLLNDALVTALKFYNIEEPEKNHASIVVKGGITNYSSEIETSEILVNLNAKESIEDKGHTIFSDYPGGALLDITYDQEYLEVIRVGNLGNTSRFRKYLEFETEEERIENIQLYKDQNYENTSYSDIIATMDDDNVRHSVHLELEVVEDVYEVEFFVPVTDYFIAKDKDGNLYIFTVSKSDIVYNNTLSALKPGDNIEVWASILYGFQLSDDKDDVIPSSIPYLVEKDGKIVYRSQFVHESFID